MDVILGSRVKSVNESITLKLNEKAQKLQSEGKEIFNLTAGQLPFRPVAEFVSCIESELNFLKNFQYSPVPGFSELRKKLISYIEKSRDISFSELDGEFDCVISNGAKHSIYNVLGTLIDPGDEVILLSPYWVSYPEMIKFWGGTPIVVPGHSYNAYVPLIEDIKRALSPRTKAMIINSPNNPTGIHYQAEWMKKLAELVSEFPDLFLISDEIYYELYYFDPKPSFFYQFNPELLNRTIIIDGISKSLACTGLRLGYAIAKKPIVSAISKIQGQTTSGASSLIQSALLSFNYEKISEFLTPIRAHLRKNANTIREKLREKNMGSCWYQTMSAFYYMLDFSQTPYFKKILQEQTQKENAFNQGEKNWSHDYAELICTRILDEKGIAIIPGSDFGMPNSARISLVLEEGPFEEAIDKLTSFLNCE